jgi:hypothetical protein
MRIRRLLLVFITMTVARLAPAQSSGPVGLVPIPYRTYVAFNPLGIPFDIFTAEVESGVAQGVTVGGTVSHLDIDDDRYTSFDLKVRYYPGEVVLRGLSLGASLGFLGYSSLRNVDVSGVNLGGVDQLQKVRASLTTPTIGIISDYNWLLGSQHRFVVGTGLGVKRVIASEEDRSTVGLQRAYVTARFIAGLAF